jgi:YfiH family protein
MAFEDLQNIIWGISEKQDGRMKILEETDTEARENRGRFFMNRGLAPERIVSAGLVHSNQVAVVKDAEVLFIAESDGLVTDQKNLILSLTVADCVPIYFCDPVRQAVGLAHAGWKGVAGNIVKEVVSNMQDEFASRPEDIVVWVGPHIGPCHFEVQNDVASQFADFGDSMVLREGKTFIDLSVVIQAQLQRSGIQLENIGFSPECTFCEDNKYFSYRRDKPARLEAMVAYIGLK